MHARKHRSHQILVIYLRNMYKYNSIYIYQFMHVLYTRTEERPIVYTPPLHIYTDLRFELATCICR